MTEKAKDGDSKNSVSVPNPILPGDDEEDRVNNEDTNEDDGYDMDSFRYDGFTASGWQRLHVYSARNMITEMEAELKKGTPVDIKSRNDGRVAPLQVAADVYACDAVKLLISRSANVNYANQTNRHTALHFAVWNFNAEMVKCLLQAKADPLIKTDRGETAQEIATRRGASFIAELIEEFQKVQPSPEAPPAPNPFAALSSTTISLSSTAASTP